MQSALERHWVKQYELIVPGIGRHIAPGLQSSYCPARSCDEIVHWLGGSTAPFFEQPVVPSPAIEHFSEHQSQVVPVWHTGSQGAPPASGGVQPGTGVVRTHVLKSGFGALLSGLLSLFSMGES